MSRKFLIALLGVLLVAALAGAGTFAYFSDTETSSGNTFTAGTLDLAVGDENPNNSPDFTIGDVKPGDSGTITYTLTNIGTIDGYLDLSGINVTDGPGPTPESEPTPDNGELSANINVTVTLGTSVLYTGALNGIAASYDADVALAASESTTLTIDWAVPEDAGNDIQGDVTTVGLTVELDQTAFNLP